MWSNMMLYEKLSLTNIYPSAPNLFPAVRVNSRVGNQFTIKCHMNCGISWAGIKTFLILPMMKNTTKYTYCKGWKLQKWEKLLLGYYVSYLLSWCFENWRLQLWCELSRNQPGELWFHHFAMIRSCTYPYFGIKSPQGWRSLIASCYARKSISRHLRIISPVNCKQQFLRV